MQTGTNSEEYRNTASVYRGAIRKAKAQLELKLARDSNNSIKVSAGMLVGSQKSKQGLDLLLNRSSKFIKKWHRKGWSTWLVFTGNVRTQISMSGNNDEENDKPLLVERRVKWEAICRNRAHTAPDKVQLRVLRELADMITKLLNVFKGSCK